MKNQWPVSKLLQCQSTSYWKQALSPDMGSQRYPSTTGHYIGNKSKSKQTRVAGMLSGGRHCLLKPPAWPCAHFVPRMPTVGVLGAEFAAPSTPPPCALWLERLRPRTTHPPHAPGLGRMELNTARPPLLPVVVEATHARHAASSPCDGRGQGGSMASLGGRASAEGLRACLPEPYLHPALLLLK